MHLPLAFRSLDVEGRSKPIPLVMCPTRSAAMSAGGCEQCRHFKSIDMAPDGRPQLCCLDEGQAAPPRTGMPGMGRARTVLELLRVPAVCASLETTIAGLLCVLNAPHGSELIPVLDDRAIPRGYVTGALLQERIADGAAIDSPLAHVMVPFLTRVPPSLSVEEARKLAERSHSGHLVALGSDGSLLGVVSAAELAWA
jgi:CBS domain-containing protein